MHQNKINCCLQIVLTVHCLVSPTQRGGGCREIWLARDVGHSWSQHSKDGGRRNKWEKWTGKCAIKIQVKHLELFWIFLQRGKERHWHDIRNLQRMLCESEILREHHKHESSTLTLPPSCIGRWGSNETSTGHTEHSKAISTLWVCKEDNSVHHLLHGERLTSIQRGVKCRVLQHVKDAWVQICDSFSLFLCRNRCA